MARTKTKKSETLNCRLDKSVSDKINEIVTEVGLTKTKTVEKAVEKFYEEYKRTGRVQVFP